MIILKHKRPLARLGPTLERKEHTFVQGDLSSFTDCLP